jgi:hypothetical protein
MSWLDAVPLALLAAVWLFVPGLLVTYGYGLRGFAAWGLAPVVSVAIIATTAAVAPIVGVSWSIQLVIAVALVIAVVVAVVAFLLRRRWPATPADPPRVTLAAAIGLVPAFVLSIITFMHGIAHPDALSQTYDAVLHYNAVASILDTHNASSLTIGSLDIPGEPGSFYPAGWHDLVSLVVMSGGFGITSTVNMVSGVIAIAVWPVSCLLLVRQVVGKSAVAMAITGLVSVAFTAFPWDLLSFGVLWPNLLGMALVPAVLAAVLSVTGMARDDAIGRGRAWLILPVAALGTGFAHPNAIFTVLVLSLVPVFTRIVIRMRRLRAEGRPRRGVTELLVAIVVFLGLWGFSDETSALSAVRNFYWAPSETPARAIGEVLFVSTTGYNALWLLAFVVLGSLLLSRRIVEIRWLVASFAITGILYVMAAGLNTPLTHKFSGFWYNDPHRLAAMLPITMVPLTVVTLVWLGRQAATYLERTPRLAGALRGRAFAASTLVIVVLLGALTGGFYVGKHAAVIQNSYTLPSTNPALDLVDPAERAFFAKVGQLTPPDAMVANNPWDGSALLWALANRRVLFPHLEVVATADQLYLAKHLDDAAKDPKVCAAANRLRVGYLVVGDSQFWAPWDGRVKNYSGFRDPGPHNRAFQLIASSGPKLKLYQLTACGRQE